MNSEFKIFTSSEMSNDEYHAKDSWVADYVSGSELSQIHETCPAAYRFSQKQPTKALEFGTQSHTNFESAELFEKHYRRATDSAEIKDLITSQTALASKLKSFGLIGTSGKQYPELLEMMTKCGEDLNVLWLIEQCESAKALVDGVELVAAKDYDACVSMRQVLEMIPAHNACMNSPTAQRELSIFGEISGVKVKVRLDHVDVVDNAGYIRNAGYDPDVTPEVVVITDYKSTSSAKPEEFDRKAYDLGYYLKMALQRDLFVKAFNEKRPVIVRLLAQEKKEPFLPLAFRLTGDHIKIGRSQYISVIHQYAQCIAHDSWPAYVNGESEINLGIPAWVQAKHKDILQ